MSNTTNRITRRQAIRCLAAGSLSLGAPNLFSHLFNFTLPNSREPAQQPRSWVVTGPGDQSSPIDSVMQKFMQNSNVRAAAFAVVKGTSLVFAHGYTYAETLSGYPVTEPRTRFRLASCTKPITSIAINQIIDYPTAGDLSLDDYAQEILKLSKPNGLDPPTSSKPTNCNGTGCNSSGFFLNAVTVRNLLQHENGWGDPRETENVGALSWNYPNGRSKPPDPAPFDPIWSYTETEKAFNLPAGTYPTKYQIASYGVSQMQACWPGTLFDYSNFGYSLLGMIIEKKRDGLSYTNCVQQFISKAVGNVNFRQSQSVLTGWPPPADEVWYHYVNSPNLITLGELKATPPYRDTIENYDSFGGLSVGAPDYCKVLAALNYTSTDTPLLKHDTYSTIFQPNWPFLGFDQIHHDPTDPNPKGLRWIKGGSLNGCATSACYSPGGFSYALFFNRGFGPTGGPEAANPPNWWPVWSDLDNAMLQAIPPNSPSLFSDPSIDLGEISI